QGVIFVVCVLLFRRGIIGELAQILRVSCEASTASAPKPQLHRFARLASRPPSTTDRQPRAPSLSTTGAGSLCPRRAGSWQAHVTACLRGKTMRIDSLLTRCAYATMTAIMLLGLGPVAQGQDLPSFVAPIAGRTASSPAETATKNVLALNSMMF